MSYAILVTAALVGPQAPSLDYWRDEYRSVLAATTERAKPQPEVVVPRLVAVYEQVKRLDDLPSYERLRMQRTLEGRMVKQLEVLVVAKHKHDRMAKRATLAGGSATAFGAQQLINLIVTTIAPDSWQQNGGKGTISFYANNPALVVRTTGEVHEQVSALIRGLGQ